jgi:hypothetical protein
MRAPAEPVAKPYRRWLTELSHPLRDLQTVRRRPHHQADDGVGKERDHDEGRSQRPARRAVYAPNELGCLPTRRHSRPAVEGWEGPGTPRSRALPTRKDLLS